MHHHLDSYAYTNNLRHLPPMQKLLFAIALLFLALITHPLTQGLIVIWLSGWTVYYAKIPAKVYGRVFMVAGLFLIMSLPALVVEVISKAQIPLVQDSSLGGIIWANWYIFISQTGMIKAVVIIMRSLACISCLLFILFTIPFAQILHILRQWRVPPLLVDLLMLMYRFVFLFLDVASQLQLAQKARGGYRTRSRWLYSISLLAGQLIIRVLQRYQQFSLGIISRGFRGEFQVYSKPSDKYSKRYALESVLGYLGLVILDLKF